MRVLQSGIERTEATRKGPSSYLWSAAWCLHAPGASAAEDWVAAHALALLAGHSGQVATALDVQAAAACLDADHRSGIDACIRCTISRSSSRVTG